MYGDGVEWWGSGVIEDGIVDWGEGEGWFENGSFEWVGETYGEGFAAVPEDAGYGPEPALSGFVSGVDWRV